MIRTEVQQLSYIERAEEDFAVSSSGIALTRPDGTAVNGMTAVATPGLTPGPEQTLVSSAFTVDMAGIWRAQWSMGVGARTLQIPEWYVATYDAVHNGIRGLLQQEQEDLPDGKIDPDLVHALRVLAVKYPNVIYRSLNVDDQYWYDQALVFLGGARVRRSQSLDKPGGPLKRETQGPVTYEYFEGAKKLSPIEVEWLGLAWEALSNVGAIGTTLRNWRDNFELWAVAGPRRGVEEYLVSDYTVHPLYAVLLAQGALE